MDAPRRRIAAIALALTAGLCGQEPAVDPALPGRIEAMLDFVKDRKMTEDFRAIGAIQELTTDLDKRNEKDKDRILKGLVKVFRTGKVRPADKIQLYRETADAMVKFGTEAGAPLQKAIEDQRIKGREYVPLRADMLRALGRTRDPKQVEYLVEQATRSPDDDIMAAAGAALGSYTDLEIRPRREAVKALVNRFGEWHMKATQLENPDPNAPIDFSRQNAARTLEKIQGPWNATLAALTGQTFTSPPDWTHWHNKNRDWELPK